MLVIKEAGLVQVSQVNSTPIYQAWIQACVGFYKNKPVFGSEIGYVFSLQEGLTHINSSLEDAEAAVLYYSTNS